MTIPNVIFISCLLCFCGNIADVSSFSDFENLSYGKDVLSGVAPPYSITPAPPVETTTKKSGFFSGIKNFFSRSSTEAPVEVSSTTPVPVVTPKIPTNSNPVQSPLSPKGQVPLNPTVGGQIPTGSSSRDYVNPNIKPGTIPIRPSSDSSIPTGNAGHPISPGQSSPSSRRDYVNTNIVGPQSGGSNIHSPIANPGQGTLAGNNLPLNPTTSSTVSPNNRRDYVAPIRPAGSMPGGGSTINLPQSSSSTAAPPLSPPNSRRDYVNPNIPTPKSPVQPNLPNQPHINNPTPNPSFPSVHPQAPNSGGRRDYVNPNFGGGQTNPLNTNDFPALPTPKNPLIKEDFPALPPPKKPAGQPILNPTPTPPNSVWSKPGGSSPTPPNRVSFVPHQPGPAQSTGDGSSSNKNQLATDDEISALTETLLTKDTNNQNKHITLNLQGKTRSTERTDEAPKKLMEVDEVALQTPTIAKMRLLFNNYEIDTLVNEYVTPIERKEENDFLDAVMSTQVMRHAMQFLQNKGLVTPDPKTHRDLVKTIWFTMYSRGQGRIGSSAFEHVFLTEIKNNTVIGLHNWVYFYEEEKAGHIDYKGYIKNVELGPKGSILKYRFDLNNVQKPVNTLFVGTSPELELALYTVCFELRPDKDCPISLNGNKLNIVTHTWRYRGKSLIGSAFPEI